MKTLPTLPLSASARARRILQGLFEEAQYGVPFLNSALLEALLSEREGQKAERLLMEALHRPALAARFKTLPLPPEWRKALEAGLKENPQIPLFKEVA